MQVFGLPHAGAGFAALIKRHGHAAHDARTVLRADLVGDIVGVVVGRLKANLRQQLTPDLVDGKPRGLFLVKRCADEGVLAQRRANGLGHRPGQQATKRTGRAQRARHVTDDTAIVGPTAAQVSGSLIER